MALGPEQTMATDDYRCGECSEPTIAYRDHRGLRLCDDCRDRLGGLWDSTPAPDFSKEERIRPRRTTNFGSSAS